MSTLQRNILPPWVDPHDPCEVSLNGFHIRFHIFGGLKHLPNADGFMLAIHYSQHDGDARAFGNVIEAALPLSHVMTRAFRCNGQNELICFITGLYHLLHQAGGLFTVHGHAATITKERANNGWTEYLCLAHKVDICAQLEDHTQEKDEIPVGSVRRADQHKFRNVW